MQEQSVKLKKKQWYPILAPQQFENVVLGETLVYEPSAMLGKTLSQSLTNLTNDIKRQHINIHFKVVEVDGNKAKTNVMGYEIVPSSIKRFFRRNSEKINLSFTCETSDNICLRVKPLILTKADVKGSTATKISNNAIQHLTKTIKKITYNDVIKDLISRKLQADLKATLNKIYPLKVCEIRYVGIEKREKPQEVKLEMQVQQ